MRVEFTIDLLVIRSMISFFNLNFWKNPLVISEKINRKDYSSGYGMYIVLKNLINLGGNSVRPYVPQIII